MRAIPLALACAFLIVFSIKMKAILAKKEAEKRALVTAKALSETTDLPEGIPTAKGWIGDERKAVEKISVNNLQITGMVTSTIYRGDTLLSQFRWYNSVDKERGWPRWGSMTLFTTDKNLCAAIHGNIQNFVIASGAIYYDPVYAINPWSKIVLHLKDIRPDSNFENELLRIKGKWTNNQ